MVQPQVDRNVTHSIELNRFLVFATTFLVLLSWIVVCVVSRRPGEMALVLFLAASAVIMVATAMTVWWYHRAGKKMPFIWIFLSALLLRLISLYGEPLFEDDYFRYLWDGYQTVLTQDPYSLAPALFFDRDVPEVFEDILSLINYPEIASVYGPVTQWIFAVGYLIDAAKVWPLQLMAGMADLAVLVILYRLGARNALLFYAWSPLLLKEFSLTAHPDIYAILAVMVSLYLAKMRLAWLAGVALALGFGAKVFAILVLPYLLSSLLSLRYWISLMGAFVMTLLAITLWYGSLLIWVPEGLKAMADSWLFNAGLYLVLLNFFEFQTIKLMLLAGFFIYGLFTVAGRLLRLKNAAANQNAEIAVPVKEWRSSQWGFRGDWLYLVFLLALPVINPWYVTWLLPFAALYPRVWPWLLSYGCLLSYWHGANAGITGAGSLWLPPAVVAVEYISVMALAAIAWILSRRFSELAAYREITGS